MELPSVITEFIDEPHEREIVRITPIVYSTIKYTAGSEVMLGIDFYAYSAMVTYVIARYKDFGSSTYEYVKELFKKYDTAMGAASECIRQCIINGYEKEPLFKFLDIIYWNVILIRQAFLVDIIPYVENADPNIILDLGYIEETFRMRYPLIDH